MKNRLDREMKVMAMYEGGKNTKQIAEELGIARSSVYHYLPRLDPPWGEGICIKSWKAFLGLPDIAALIGDTELDQRWSRTYYRWRHETKLGSDLGMCDAFCALLGIHVNVFFEWCREVGREAWTVEQPAWEICTEDFEVWVRVHLAQELKAGVPFEQAWRNALAAVGPVPHGWTISLVGDKPINFLRKAMKQEYNIARERLAA